MLSSGKLGFWGLTALVFGLVVGVGIFNLPQNMAASSVVMMLFLLVVVMADNVYLAALHITGLMIIPCYLFTGMFLCKVATDFRTRLLGAVTVAFCLWMAYAGGLLLMLMTSLFYLLGTGFYIRSCHDNYPAEKRLFTTPELCFFIFLCLATAVTLILLFRHGSNPAFFS